MKLRILLILILVINLIQMSFMTSGSKKWLYKELISFPTSSKDVTAISMVGFTNFAVSSKLDKELRFFSIIETSPYYRVIRTDSLSKALIKLVWIKSTNYLCAADTNTRLKRFQINVPDESKEISFGGKVENSGYLDTNFS